MPRAYVRLLDNSGVESATAFAVPHGIAVTIGMDLANYAAVQLGLVEFIKPQRINKPTAGRLKKAGVEGAKFMREFTLGPGSDDLKTGDQVRVAFRWIVNRVQ